MVLGLVIKGFGDYGENSFSGMVKIWLLLVELWMENEDKWGYGV